MKNLYQDSYAFLEKQSIFLSKQNQLYEKYFLLENLHELELNIPKYCIDILPQQMPSILFFDKFDYDRNSSNPFWRDNYQEYFIKFRKFLYTVLGYSQKVYIETTTFEDDDRPTIFQVTNNDDMEMLEQVIVSSLNEYDNTIISMPEESTLLRFSDMFIEIITTDRNMLELMKTVACANGVYCHLVANDD